MDQPPDRWLDVVKHDNHEILYHPSKANVVADDLSCKSAGISTPAICMRRSVDSPLVGLIWEAQAEGMHQENWKLERFRGENTRFVQDSRGIIDPMRSGVGSNVWWG